jgi:toxin ParE1/3/4
MTAKPVVLRQSARDDLRDAVAYYALEAGPRVAKRFVEAYEASYRRLEITPGMGSPRYEHQLGLSGLRNLQLDRFPYLIFYVEYADQVEIWRILHAQSDVAAWIEERPA